MNNKSGVNHFERKNMDIKYFRKEVCPIDTGMIGDDEYTFNVLSKILKSECTLTVTDFEKFIICYSSAPYPVWIWTSDDIYNEIWEKIWQIVCEEFPLGKYRFNVKYSFANFMIERADSLQISLNMQVYTCNKTIVPQKNIDGALVLAEDKHIEEVVAFLTDFHNELNMDKKSYIEYRSDAEKLISGKRLFLWKDSCGETVAMCAYGVNGSKCSLNNVITRYDKRRMGYASRLVFEVTNMILDSGKTPTLYTNADYIASNACYRSIGYQLIGSLCTVDVVFPTSKSSNRNNHNKRT